MECGTKTAATVFGPSYRRAAVMQVVLALAATCAAIFAWFAGAPVAWLAGALLMFAVIPFTLLVIRPVNQRLLDPTLDHSSEATHLLLQKWGRLHAVRSFLALAASIIFVGLLAWS
jgi:hypothetical protein